jgi:uncharacterized protein YwgA
MNISEFLLALIDASGGVRGRTMLQKKAFFVSLLSRVPVELGYDAHYYCPYSAAIEGKLTQLKNLGFVEEASTGFGVVSGGFEVRRYDYRVTKDGRKILEPVLQSEEYKAIKQALLAITEAGDPNYVELSIAAKAFYILKKRGKRMTAEELQREAQKFDWKIEDQSLVRAIDFLKQVGMAAN